MHTLLFVTGLSGAGLSSALKVLEDLGYEVFDNLPISLIQSVVEQARDDRPPMAFGIDTRTRGFDAEALAGLMETYQSDRNYDLRLLFMTCDDATLQRRFSETRRRHPLAVDRPVTAGIEKERMLLSPLLPRANLVLDTSHLSVHDLRRIIEGHYGMERVGRLTVTVMSFGFRNGLPREADIVLDARFLDNPHWVPELKNQTGQDQPVADYIDQDQAFAPFIANVKTLLEPLLPRYLQEGKSYLTLAIGCTGGRHRSVYIVELLSAWLKSKNLAINTYHRDLPIPD